MTRYGTYGARARGTTAATYRGRVAEISEVQVFRHLRNLSGARHQSERLEVEHRNFIAIECAPRPTNQTELRSFLAMCNDYRPFFHGFAKISRR